MVIYIADNEPNSENTYANSDKFSWKLSEAHYISTSAQTRDTIKDTTHEYHPIPGLAWQLSGECTHLVQANHTRISRLQHRQRFHTRPLHNGLDLDLHNK